MFSYNGANWSESKTTRIFRRVRQVAALGAKSAVSDCILLSDCAGTKHFRAEGIKYLAPMLSFAVLT